MKQLSVVLFACLVLISFSCSEDEDGGSDSSYEFKEQVAQGTINDKDWTLGSGYASSSSNDRLSINLFGKDFETPCDVFSDRGVLIFFTLDNKVGVTELKFDFDDLDNSKTATFLDPDAGGDFGPLNIIATEGAIEILSVTDSEVKGRLDIRNGGDNTSSVNGNFTIDICQ
ncbi:hypothetical protein N7E81_05005 [Reichenbachiella carrageenanivorans]|uniref:Uncharacterized protein n=1 Tax=Reichenbachiella carrageenanivorans TaxID=2979869 RepID=A0ABY6D2R2_9BACT|nr:hypothetical protein [Reichenbachiella carrageenanivorans]UXX80457.1 hypothetical protein N7E81_05005 [Reichenbachiella carrageenanivorans]